MFSKTSLISASDKTAACQVELQGLTGLHEVGEGDADQKLLQY